MPHREITHSRAQGEGGPAIDHIGIDLHKWESQICLLAEKGEVIERRIRTGPQRFVRHVQARLTIRDALVRTRTRYISPKPDSVFLGEVRHESTPRALNAHAAWAAEVRGHNQEIMFDGILQQGTPNARSFEHIDGSVGRQIRIKHLHWSVDRITAENCRCTTIRANAQLPGSMTRQWQQC